MNVMMRQMEMLLNDSQLEPVYESLLFEAECLAWGSQDSRSWGNATTSKLTSARWSE